MRRLRVSFPGPDMTTYHCMIDLKPTANAIAFAHAVQNWFEMLKSAGKIESWQLQRRKLHLAGPGFGDFLLSVELHDLAQLDLAFGHLGEHQDVSLRAYEQMHGMIERCEVGLYRSFPDPVKAERLALI